LISVIMPFHNAQKYLAAAVESVLAQTFGDFEFILLDDGSTDDSLYLCKKYERQDSRIRLITRPNKGFTKSLNECIGIAYGQLIARMDADDICLQQRFERQIEHLNKYPDRVLVGAQAMLIDEDGEELCPMPELVLEHEAIDKALMAKKWPIVHPSVMMRTEAVKAVGGYNEAYRTAQDHDLFLKLAEKGRLANLPEILIKYREHHGAAGSARSDEQNRNVDTMVAAACVRRGLPEPTNGHHQESLKRSVADEYRIWAWWALRGGNVGTARKHAWAAVRTAPLSTQSWRTLFCAIRGR